ncbi:hypothetical protein DFH09DRAFT_1312248 [Mycena vulgaris]|nr:hypothetical protein DFH09DRAFT_1312248 [Mycena vulgaris]
MKFCTIPIVAASAGLLASASPMRVVMVSSNLQPMRPPAIPSQFQNGAPGHVMPAKAVAAPCGSRLRQKASSFSAAFRLALGFGSSKNPTDAPPIYVHVTPAPPRIPSAWVEVGKTSGGDPILRLASENGRLSPTPSSSTGAWVEEGRTAGGDPIVRLQNGRLRHNHHLRPHAHHGERSFLMRVHMALMALGPWEGRAVAFVLGCGIGVLLRMLFVVAVVTVRAIRGPRPALNEYEPVDSDAEEIFVAPPQYTYPVEKVALVEAEVQAEEAK